VPLTVLRDGPLGVGAVQRYVDHDPDEHFFTLRDDHEARFREFAWFDVLANNTDRKGGHCLHDVLNHEIVGIDHGLTFHPMWKLRTVIWDFADEPVPDALLDDVRRVATWLDDGPLGEALAGLLSGAELAALAMRHGIPAIHPAPEFAEAGGLISYAGSYEESNRIVGIYTGRVLRGDKPSDLPVQQPAKMELVINAKAAKALGLVVPAAALARADRVIQ